MTIRAVLSLVALLSGCMMETLPEKEGKVESADIQQDTPPSQESGHEPDTGCGYQSLPVIDETGKAYWIEVPLECLPIEPTYDGMPADHPDLPDSFENGGAWRN